MSDDETIVGCPYCGSALSKSECERLRRPEPSEEQIGKHVWPLQAILAKAHLWRLRNAGVQYPDLDDLREILERDETGTLSPALRIAELEAQLESVRALADEWDARAQKRYAALSGPAAELRERVEGT